MKPKGNIAVILICVVALLLALVVLFKKNTTPSIEQPPVEVTKQLSKTFESKVMKFKITVSPEITVQENLGQVVISSSSGKLYVDRNGTNFSNLKDYINDLSIKNKANLQDLRYYTINNTEAASGLIGSEKNILLYSDGSVYLFTTNFPNLYPLLDQIVQTFKYLP